MIYNGKSRAKPKRIIPLTDLVILCVNSTVLSGYGIWIDPVQQKCLTRKRERITFSPSHGTISYPSEIMLKQ